MTPATIGRYQILGELGRGGMATVYRAYDPVLGREVALKALPRELLHDPEFRARFRREIEAVASLEHPAIVPVYEAGEHEGQPFMVMRLMTGGSLAERLARGALPLPQAARIIGQVAPALDAAHAAGLIHRDVKPDNVLFDAEDRPFLADFGIVSLADVTTKLTRSGVIGTPDYMAPELSRPGGLTPLIDVYAMGVMLFQLLTGRLPYTADTPLGTLVAHVTEPLPNLLALRPELPEAAQTILAGAMAKDPRARYQSVGALAADLTALAAGQSPRTLRVAAPPTYVASPERIAPRPVPPESRGLARPVLVALALGAVLVVAVLLGRSLGDWLAGPAPSSQVAATALPYPSPIITDTAGNSYAAPARTAAPYPPPGPQLTITTGELGMLARQIVAAGYSQSLDALVLVGRDPDQVNIIRPPDWDGVTFDLPARANALAISPGGLLAAVGHEHQITLIELEQGSVVKTVPVEFAVSSLAVDDEGQIYYSPGELGAQMRVVTIGTAERPLSGLVGPGDLALTADGTLYSASRADTPSRLAAYTLIDGAATLRSTTPPRSDACGRVWARPDNRLVATGCGEMLTGDEGPGLGLSFRGPLGKLGDLAYASFAPNDGPILALTSPPPYGAAPGEQWPRVDAVYVFDPVSLSLLQTIGLPPSEWGPAAARSSATVEPRYIFSNAAGTTYYVVVYAPGLRDYGVVALGVSGTGEAFSPAPPAPLPALGPGPDGGLPAPSPPTGVTSRPIDMAVTGAAYSRALDRMILVAPRPHRLVIFNPEEGGQLLVELPAAPTGLALSPNGLLAAVRADTGVAFVDLQTAQVLGITQVDGRNAEITLSDDGRLYVVDQARNKEPLRVFDAASGSELGPSAALEANGYRYVAHPSGQSLYGLFGGSPPMIERLAIEAGEPSFVYWSEASAEHRLGGDLWLAADGARLFTACGGVYTVTESAGDDLAYAGELTGVGGLSAVFHAPAAGQILALPGPAGDPETVTGCVPPATTPDEGDLLVYSAVDLTPLRVLDLPDLEAGGQTHPFSGRYVFANNAGTSYYVLVKLRNRTAQLPDYHVLLVPAEILS